MLRPPAVAIRALAALLALAPLGGQATDAHLAAQAKWALARADAALEAAAGAAFAKTGISTTTVPSTIGSPSQLTCYYDSNTGVVTGLAVDSTASPVCSGASNPDNIGVRVSMVPGQVISAVDVAASPKTGLVTGMTFHVANLTEGGMMTEVRAVECGKARSEADKAATVSAPHAKKEGGSGSSPAWLAGVSGEPCTAGASAPILPQNLEFFPDATPSLSGKPLLDKLLAKAGPPPAETAVPLALTPGTLRWEFTPQACRASISCVPGTVVFVTSLGCLLAPGEEVYFVDVGDNVALTNVTCPAGGGGDDGFSYIVLEPGEEPSCVETYSCENSPPPPTPPPTTTPPVTTPPVTTPPVTTPPATTTAAPTAAPNSTVTPTPTPTGTTPAPTTPPPTTTPPLTTTPPPPPPDNNGYPGLIIEGAQCSAGGQYFPCVTSSGACGLSDLVGGDLGGNCPPEGVCCYDPRALCACPSSSGGSTDNCGYYAQEPTCMCVREAGNYLGNACGKGCKESGCNSLTGGSLYYCAVTCRFNECHPNAPFPPGANASCAAS